MRGAQVDQVDELSAPVSFDLNHPYAVLPIEYVAYAEPKALSQTILKELVATYGTFRAVASAIGASDAFVRQKVQNKKYTRSK